MSDVLRRTRAKVNRIWAEHSFNQVGKRILNTPPLAIRGESPIFLSMVRRRDLVSYLIAIKSLYLGVGHGRIVIINEQSVKNKHSLRPHDVALLNHHIPVIVVVNFA